MNLRSLLAALVLLFAGCASVKPKGVLLDPKECHRVAEVTVVRVVTVGPDGRYTTSPAYVTPDWALCGPAAVDP